MCSSLSKKCLECLWVRKSFHFIYAWFKSCKTKTGITRMSPTRSWCYKTFFGGNLVFPKIKNLNIVCFADWTCTKTLKQCYFQLNYIQTLFICSKMVYSCCFGLRGNLDFPEFLQKKFYNINYRSSKVWKLFKNRNRWRQRMNQN